MTDGYPDLVLEVETPRGLFVRSIMPASAVGSGPHRGSAVEAATRSAAAWWGLPDFVFRPAVQHRGASSREIGDVILVAGPRAASTQVKSRTTASGNADRERAWLNKHIRAGIRQANGTIRHVTLSGRADLVSERGRTVTIPATSKRWLRIVVVDHPGLDGYTPPPGAVVLLRRDWEFLFEQLASTYAVLEYVERVAQDEPWPLGREPVRYYQCAAADVVAKPQPIDPRLAALNFDSGSAPLLPQEPAGQRVDDPQILFRWMLEDLAVIDDGSDESDRAELLAAIDSLPITYRSQLARSMFDWLGEVQQVDGDEVAWRFRRLHWTDRPLVLVGAASRHNPSVEAGFRGWAALRHQQFLELMPERVTDWTVAVLLTPRFDGLRPWDTTAVALSGDLDLSKAFRYALELLWGDFVSGGNRTLDWDAIEAAFAAADVD